MAGLGVSLGASPPCRESRRLTRKLSRGAKTRLSHQVWPLLPCGVQISRSAPRDVYSPKSILVVF